MTHVYKTYPSQIAALTDINLEIFPGQFAFIAGPSGSEKQLSSTSYSVRNGRPVAR